MRTNLKNIGSDERHTYVATFERTGTKKGYMGWPVETLLLVNVCRADTDEVITDHLWFNLTKGFSEANLQKGDRVQFDARVAIYEKGYKGYIDYYHDDYYYPPVTIDYKLSHPTHIVNLNSEKDTNH